MSENRSYSSAERRKILMDCAQCIAGYKGQAKDIAQAIKDQQEAVCNTLSIAPKALKVVLAYIDMSPGERIDLDTALTLAQQALDDSGMDDLFGAPGETALERVTRERRKRREAAAVADLAECLSRDGASMDISGPGIEPVTLGEKGIAAAATMGRKGH